MTDLHTTIIHQKEIDSKMLHNNKSIKLKYLVAQGFREFLHKSKNIHILLQ